MDARSQFLDLSPGPEGVAFEFLPFIRAYKDGHVERFFGTDIVPPSIQEEESQFCISSKDVQILPQINLSARIFLPSKIINESQKNNSKLPLLIYFHGGAFCLGSPFCTVYHNYLTSIVKEANVIAISVDYRLAPENLIPAAYEDAWAVLNWVSTHSNGSGPESWLNHYADLQRVFLAGDSAGGNISANTVAQLGVESLPGLNVMGLCLIHPDFASKNGEVYKSWTFACPDSSGGDDPRMNPGKDSRVSNLGCKRVLVFVAGEDPMKERGVYYYETLKKSGWNGEVEMIETKGEGHVFHLFNPTCHNALTMLHQLASFLNYQL